MILHVTTEIPASRRVQIELPADAPTGVAHLEIRVSRPGEVLDFPMPVIDVDSLPRYFDEQSGEWKRVGRSGVVREVKTA